MADLLAAFLDYYGFIVVQQNGQRIIGARESESTPTFNEIFLSKLPKEFKETDIIPYLLQFRDICKIRTMLNFNGDCRGFCYINFREKVSSIRACQIFSKLQIGNRSIKCTVSDEDCRIIFVAFNWRIIRVMDFLWELLQEINDITEGKTGVEKITVHDHNAHGLVHCFIKFNEHGKAASIRKHLRNKNKNIFYNAYFDWKKRCPHGNLPEQILDIYPNEKDINKVPKINLININKCLDYCDLQVMLI